MAEEVSNELSGGNTYRFDKPILQNKMPPGRGGSTVIYAEGKLVVFGGHYFAGDEKFIYLNEVWMLDTQKYVWHRITCSGEVPPPRYGHCAHILGSRMFIFGGKGERGAVYKDIYYLDLLEWVWVPVHSISNSPPARFFFASEMVGKKLVIHGGWDSDEVLEDLWIFNTDSFMWLQPRTAGFPPCARYGHSITLTLDGRLLIFGGCYLKSTNFTHSVTSGNSANASSISAKIPQYLNDIYQLDINKMIWTHPQTHGARPTGRYGHSATLLKHNRIAVFGGWGKGGCQVRTVCNDNRAQTLHILDTITMTWYIPKKSGKNLNSTTNTEREDVNDLNSTQNSVSKPLKHLYNHAACRAGSETIYIFGGYDGRQALGEFYTLDCNFSNQ